MHKEIAHNFEEELERYLGGEPSAAFQTHLDDCASCRSEVAEFISVTMAIREFRIEASDTFGIYPEPSPAFYNKVAARINERSAPRGWNFFAPGAAFFQRVAFASLLILAGLGSYLVIREADFSGADAASIMADYSVQEAPARPEAEVRTQAAPPVRDHLLLTLATYRGY